MSIATYYTQLKSLHDEFHTILPLVVCSCEIGKLALEQSDQERAMSFLQGLSDRFSGVRSQILLLHPFPPINWIYIIVREQESQQNIETNAIVHFDAAALAARSIGPAKCHRPVCDHCKTIGHVKEKCFKLHGYPTNYVPRNKKSINSVNAVSFLQEPHNGTNGSSILDATPNMSSTGSFVASYPNNVLSHQPSANSARFNVPSAPFPTVASTNTQVFTNAQYNQILNMLDSEVNNSPKAKPSGPKVEDFDWSG